ncbi:MAG: hypothetical protein GY928_40260 [Colwellia sp.]|nr:hypothetical protein [Colwellia sp.]
MEIRKDLVEVSPYISRLLSFSKEFSESENYWSHLKNKEDFKFISRIPHQEQNKVEALYCDGRDMAIYMSSALSEVNFDFSAYPTLSSIVHGFDESWVNGNYDPNVPDVAAETCASHGVELWSVNQMISLFRKQEKLLSAVRVTLNVLKRTDLYKLENGIEIMEEKKSIVNVSGVTGSSININSDNANASVTQTYNEPSIFSDIIEVLKNADLAESTRSELIDNTQSLALAHEKGTFSESYKEFMQNVSAHITVFTPFLTGLAALL